MEKSCITAYVRHGCFLYDGSSCYGRRSKSSSDRGGFLYSQRTLDDSPELCIQGHCLDECDQQCDRQWYSVYEQYDQQLWK